MQDDTQVGEHIRHQIFRGLDQLHKPGEEHKTGQA